MKSGTVLGLSGKCTLLSYGMSASLHQSAVNTSFSLLVRNTFNEFISSKRLVDRVRRHSSTFQYTKRGFGHQTNVRMVGASSRFPLPLVEGVKQVI